MKKILFIIFLIFTTVSFAQQIENEVAVSKKNAPTSITAVSASPNPFSVSTRISYNSTKIQAIKLVVKNLLGKTVFIKNIDSKKGINTIYFERNNISKGMYIYTLQSDTEVISKRLVIR